MSITRDIIESAPIADCYDLLLRKEHYSFYMDRPFERLIRDTQWELQELMEWIQNNDKENIKEELADVIFNTCQVIQALFKRELITPEDLANTWKAQKQKIYKRQPFLKDNSEKPNSWEEETALFKKLKEQC
jgi:NTP pyrophosphatase (non-canonical NTP hydrolase)